MMVFNIVMQNRAGIKSTTEIKIDRKTAHDIFTKFSLKELEKSKVVPKSLNAQELDLWKACEKFTREKQVPPILLFIDIIEYAEQSVWAAVLYILENSAVFLDTRATHDSQRYERFLDDLLEMARQVTMPKKTMKELVEEVIQNNLICWEKHVLLSKVRDSLVAAKAISPEITEEEVEEIIERLPASKKGKLKNFVDRSSVIKELQEYYTEIQFGGESYLVRA